MMGQETNPRVYAAISAVTRALARKGIAKTRQNPVGGYSFRGIDDIYAGLAPLLARHKLCVLPQMLSREQREHRSSAGDLVFAVCVHANFDIISVADGSRHSIQTFGEAIDGGDKATSKAMSSAYKYAMIQAFCIPVGAGEDADAITPMRISAADLIPVQGWQAWADEIQAIANSCETLEALDRMQTMHRERLRALARAEPSSYAEIGRTIQVKRASLSPRERAAA